MPIALYTKRGNAILTGVPASRPAYYPRTDIAPETLDSTLIRPRPFKEETCDRDDEFKPDQKAPDQPVEQAAAICLRPSTEQDEPEILLIASRSTGAWGIPKGHIETGETSHQAARREAFEEVGAVGKVTTDAIGAFNYRKPGIAELYRVTVHILHLRHRTRLVAEAERREAQWVPLSQASQQVENPDLAIILQTTLRQIGIGNCRP